MNHRVPPRPSRTGADQPVALTLPNTIPCRQKLESYLRNNTNPAAVPEPELSEDQLTDFFARVRTLLAACGPDRNGQAIAAVCASIDEGIVMRPRLYGVLLKLGFKREHANIILDGGTKNMRHDVPWYIDEGGRYRLTN